MKKVIYLLVVLMRFAFCGAAEKYILSEVQANWFEAQNLCRAWNMNLATIHSRADQDAVEQFLKASTKPGGSAFWVLGDRIWIGGNDLAEDRTFRWISNGGRALFTNWNVGEPNHNKGGPENCVNLWLAQANGLEWKWNDDGCRQSFHFICEETVKSAAGTQMPFVLSYGCGRDRCQN